MPSLYKRRLIQFLEAPLIKFFELKNEIIINSDKCIKCSMCVSTCPVRALRLEEKIVVDKKKCILCYCCHEVCLNNAISFKRKSVDGSGALPNL
jgi:NAD-dependent dihydropyrimidine dehydrogenase PreA subunit